MPSVILLGSLLMNTPQQNAGAFVGEYNFAGWDANRKMSQAHGGEFGSQVSHPDRMRKPLTQRDWWWCKSKTPSSLVDWS